MSAPLSAAAIVAAIEHTLLRPDSTQCQIEAHCREAIQEDLFGVCVGPVWVPLAARLLRGTGVRLVTTAGFPLGSELTATKVAQALQAARSGADEVDMVLNIGALKSGLLEWAREDMAAVARACHSCSRLLKVIIETCYLSSEEKVVACRLAVEAGADFVKTSTGFGAGGATVADVALMRRGVPGRVGVKAAGGIRDLQATEAMMAAGASRIGTSAGAAIARAARERERGA